MLTSCPNLNEPMIWIMKEAKTTAQPQPPSGGEMEVSLVSLGGAGGCWPGQVGLSSRGGEAWAGISWSEPLTVPPYTISNIMHIKKFGDQTKIFETGFVIQSKFSEEPAGWPRLRPPWLALPVRRNTLTLCPANLQQGEF